MKEPLNPTKVVVRHLPPSLPLSSFFDQIDPLFSSRYHWSSFCPPNSSSKNQRYARAYINFNSAEDVFEFAEFFNGHVFVNEKGTQYKAIVEYAPSQRVPRHNAKRDGREGTIYKDPEYVEFLEQISKPVENLPSADIQLERKEAERAGIQEAPIVTPLMEFVRRRRAAKSSSHHLVGTTKASGRSGLPSPGKSRSSKVSEKKKYILKTSGKTSNGKDKSTYILVPQRENQSDAPSRKEAPENDGGSMSHDATKKRILLLKGKDQETSQVSDGSTQAKVLSTSDVPSPVNLKLNQRHDASGRIIRSILMNKESRQSPSSSVHLEQKHQSLYAEKSKRPPRPSNSRHASASEQSPLSSDYSGAKSVNDRSSGNEMHGFAARERQDRRTRSRERADRGVWTPLLRSDASRGVEYRSNISDPTEGKVGDSKYDTLQSGQSVEVPPSAGGRNNSYLENGPQRLFGRRGPVHSGKDDGSIKRGSSAGHGLHEKQVWVQKSASGS